MLLLFSEWLSTASPPSRTLSCYTSYNSNSAWLSLVSEGWEIKCTRGVILINGVLSGHSLNVCTLSARTLACVSFNVFTYLLKPLCATNPAGLLTTFYWHTNLSWFPFTVCPSSGQTLTNVSQRRHEKTGWEARRLNIRGLGEQIWVWIRTEKIITFYLLLSIRIDFLKLRLREWRYL